ncbi:glycosyltransferase family 4 protein [Nodularia chucula]|uniref:glycosyltransferase family 4 protein n=1 Tax=Nodularia chucula TaxID=3093667 RepID=UPI0039C745CF
MKIAISIWMFKQATGGLQSHAEQLAYELLKQGHQVVIVTRFSTFIPEGRGYMLSNEAEDKIFQDGVEIRHLIYPEFIKPIQFLITTLCHKKIFLGFAIWLYIQQVKATAIKNFSDCELIHHVGQSTALVGYAADYAASYLNIPFLIQPTIHPNQIGDSAEEIRFYKLADRLLFYTEFERQFFLKKLQINIPCNVVGSGVHYRNDGNAERFRKLYGIEGPLVLFVGRKEPDKGYDLVISAWKKARTQISNLVLCCIGPGSVRSPKMPNLLDLEYVDNQLKNDALAACDCLCVPSQGESFGIIFMEAAQYRKPIIARRLPVLVELLGDQSALFLGSEIDFNRVQLEENELSKGIVSLLSNKELGYQMGKNAFHASQRFTWDKIVANFIYAYQEEL